MEKIIKGFILAIIVAFILCGCTSKSNIKEISFNEFKNKIENKDSFVIYIGNKECIHCEEYKPTLEEVLKEYQITIYHLDNKKLTDKEKNEFTKYLSISGTPTIAFIEDGEEESTLNRIVGVKSKEFTIEKFEINGYIK